MITEEFRKDLESLINKHSIENGSDTPDFMLAEYLLRCLAAYERVIAQREKWYEQKEETTRILKGKGF